jgi:hypothetical protein
MSSQNINIVFAECEKSNYKNDPTVRDILLQSEITQEIQIANQ